jgi:hypothetical protein
MYTVVHTNKYSIKEFLNWNELLTTIENGFYLSQTNIQSTTGKNYIELYTESDSVYIIGLNQLEIDYIKLKITKE